MRISFIIPIYNVEPYLRQCVESITKQNYRDVEVILVDDESLDGSSGLCDELAREDNRIKVVHQPHGGLSNARNTGLQYVSGEYLMFVDSDDYLVCGDDKLERLVSIIEENGCPDFLALNFYISSSSGNNLTKHRDFDETLCAISDKDNLIKYLVMSGNLPVQAWAKLLRVDFVRKQGLRFLDGRISEDNPWFVDLLDKSETFLFVNEYIYVYRRFRPGSITNTFSLYYFDSIISNIEYHLNRMDSLGFKEESREYLLSFISVGFCSTMMQLNRLPESVRKDKWEELKQYSFLLNYDRYPKVKMVNRFKKVFGLEITKLLLQIFNRLRIAACRR